MATFKFGNATVKKMQSNDYGEHTVYEVVSAMEKDEGRKRNVADLTWTFDHCRAFRLYWTEMGKPWRILSMAVKCFDIHFIPVIQVALLKKDCGGVQREKWRQ